MKLLWIMGNAYLFLEGALVGITCWSTGAVVEARWVGSVDILASLELRFRWCGNGSSDAGGENDERSAAHD